MRGVPQISAPSKLTVTRVAAARTKQLTRVAVDKINAASRADGASETGLTTLIWVNALNMAGDALVLISLAGTLFFSAPGEQQRGNVALYLLVTVAPFAIVAPILGPALDRLAKGRRFAIAATFAGRALLCWVLAANYTNFGLYPAALGLMVLSKACGVLRGSVVPRVLPEKVPLITANARMNIFGLVTAGVLGVIGVGIANVSFLGFGWELGFTIIVFCVGAWVSLKLPPHVDSDQGADRAAVLRAGKAGQDGRTTRTGRRSLGPHVVTALRATAAQRGLGGFLTFFLAFYIQETLKGLDGWLALGSLALAAGAGSFLGTFIGARVKLNNPDNLVLVSTGAAVTVCVLAAIMPSLPFAITVAFVGAVANALGKFGLDAIIQREVPANLAASAFGRSETVLQLAWVFGGALGILLPTRDGMLWLGFLVAAVLLVASFGLTLLGRHRYAQVKPVPPSTSGQHPNAGATTFGGGLPPRQTRRRTSRGSRPESSGPESSRPESTGRGAPAAGREPTRRAPEPSGSWPAPVETSWGRPEPTRPEPTWQGGWSPPAERVAEETVWEDGVQPTRPIPPLPPVPPSDVDPRGTGQRGRDNRRRDWR